MSRRTARLGLTTRGSALLTAGITAAICGIGLGQRDLVRVAFLLIAAPLVAAIVVSRSRLSVSCQRSVQPDRVAPGFPVLIQITLTNQSLLPTGSLMLEDSLPSVIAQRARFTLDSLRGREQRSLAYRLPLASRGHYQIGPLQMRLSDPFGLVERTRSFRSVSPVVVLPAVEPLPRAQLPGAWDSANQITSHSVGSLGADDASIRDYRHGDDLRKVHWRSTARLGTMMVRQEERPWHSRTLLILDSRAIAHRHQIGARPGPGRPETKGAADSPGRPDARDGRDLDSFEWAVSAAASIAVLLRARGRDLDVISAGRSTDAGNPQTLLTQLADLTLSGESDLRDAVELVGQIGRDSSIFAVLGTLDETSLRLLTRERRAPGAAVAMLLDTVSWTDVPAEVRQRADAAYELTRITLVGAGWRVVVVRRGDSVEDSWASLVSSAPMPAQSRS